MKKFKMLFTVKLSIVKGIEAETKDEARKKTWDEFSTGQMNFPRGDSKSIEMSVINLEDKGGN